MSTRKQDPNVSKTRSRQQDTNIRKTRSRKGAKGPFAISDDTLVDLMKWQEDMRKLKSEIDSNVELSGPHGKDLRESIEGICQILGKMEEEGHKIETRGFSKLKTEGELEQLKIRRGPGTLVYDDAKAKQASRQLAGDTSKLEHWTSKWTFDHLKMLNRIASPNEAGARLFIDTFCFRLNSLTRDPNSALVMSLEQNLNVLVERAGKREDLSGPADYVILRGSKGITGQYYPSSDLNLERNQGDLTLFIQEAKSLFKEPKLELHIPQIVGQMYAGMKMMGKNVIRGALSNGHNWIFIILEADASGSGAVYHCTENFTLFASR
ncbi:hypothetical protein DFP72DRAFT_1176908, partial [Ephemerocybe angulata]